MSSTRSTLNFGLFLERTNAVNDSTSNRDRTEEEILTYEVSDEALESAAGTGMGNWTFGACTGLNCTSPGG
jgi:hypothetical protein